MRGPSAASWVPAAPKNPERWPPFYRAVAERRGCAFLDAEGIAEFNKTDCMHLTRKGHRALAEKLAELVPKLVK